METEKRLSDNPEAGLAGAGAVEARSDNGVQQDNEPKSALAIGLPNWSIEPPAVVVRRKVRAI